MPAGEIARHALPWQGAREQSAGVTLTGRVPTTTEGGGGAVEWRGGGGGAWRRVGPPVEVTLEPTSVASATCEKERGCGGEEGPGAHAGRGGGGGAVGGCAREGEGLRCAPPRAPPFG